ncbi:MAG: hypothetical protein QOD98_1770 [Nocardioidaceae bacterium]|jgi:hypothetical protein|nr:hypothetical protein [Nocardioidaceae bacterium]
MFGALGAAAAVLLLWSGLVKLSTPVPVAGLVSTPLAVRGLGLAEVAVGAWFLAAGGTVSAAALAASYLVFTALTLRLTTSRRSVPCGCFGRSDAPTGVVHVVVDAVAAGAAIVAVARPPGPLGGFTDAAPTVAAVGLAQVLLLAALAHLLVTSLPELLADRARVVAGS